MPIPKPGKSGNVIAPSGKPSAEPLRCLPLNSVPFHQELLSEYERSFRPFENYRYQNGQWTLRRMARDQNEWLNELQDTRRRALENKEKLRGDHFSRDHLLQIPSTANAFWEPMAYALIPQEQHSSNGMELAAPYRAPLIRENGERVIHPAVAVVAVADGNDRRPYSAAVAVQTNNPLLAAKHISQSTQTLEDQDLNPVVLTDPPTRTEHENTGAVTTAFRPVLDSSRLDILRKAKYVDARDNLLVTSVLPRSSSLRSGLNRSWEGGRLRRYTSNATGLDGRSRSPLSDKNVKLTSATNNSYRRSDNQSEDAKRSRPLEVLPAFFPAVEKRATKSKSVEYDIRKEKMQSNNGSGNLLAKHAGNLLPVSAFTISPPKRETIRYGEGHARGSRKDVKGEAMAWDIPPPAGKDRNPVRLGLTRSFSAGLRRTSNLRPKEKGLAWVEL